jgi:hypothetical protein
LSASAVWLRAPVFLEALAGERRLRQVMESGGFTRLRRATETPFHLVLEARS